MEQFKTISDSTTLGFFDSGVGGLSILQKCFNLKAKALVYFADAKHLPYGNKTPEFLLERGIVITKFFLKQNIDTIVVACHTSSATTLNKLKKLFPQVTYIDMLVPTIDMALKKTKSGRIGVMATQASIDSHVHKKLLLDRNSNISVFEQACPDFVPLIEAQASEEKFNVAIKKYLKPLLAKNIDTLILGCTHYAFLEKLIQIQAPTITLISAANCIILPNNQEDKPIITIHSNARLEVKSFINSNTNEKILYSLVNFCDL